jgi:hypothetical protein
MILERLDTILEGIFLGFPLSILLSFLLSLISNKFKDFHNRFVLNAFRVIRIFGIIFFVYFILLFKTNTHEFLGVHRSPSDFYRTIFYTLRYLLLIVFSQMFWLKNIRRSQIKRGIIILLIFVLSLYSSLIISKFIAYHSLSVWRDYIPKSTSTNSTELSLILSISILFLKRIIYFSALVFITWFISDNYKKSTHE